MSTDGAIGAAGNREEWKKISMMQTIHDSRTTKPPNHQAELGRIAAKRCSAQVNINSIVNNGMQC